MNITIINPPPYQPCNPYPDQDANKIPIDTDLSWTGGDPYGDPVTYDVYFDTTNPPTTLVSNGQLEITYDPVTMNFNQTYYWQVVAWDDLDVSNESPIWSFKTIGIPPEISNVTMKASDPLDTELGFGWENFSCIVTDSDGVDDVKLILIVDTTTEYPMTKDGDDCYYCNITLLNAEEYTYYIWANDTNDSENTSTPQPFALPMNEDVNEDGSVGFVDIMSVAGTWGATGPQGWIRPDVNNDGLVGFVDIMSVAGKWGQEW